MTIRIDYRLVGVGWAECDVFIDGSQAKLTSSYLSDSLGGLADAALQIVQGATEARCSFDEEPGEYRWIMERDGDRLRLRILEFPHLWGDQPDHEGEVLIDEECGACEFVAAVRDTLRHVLDAHGMDGYKEQWAMHEFPAVQLKALVDAGGRMGH